MSFENVRGRGTIELVGVEVFFLFFIVVFGFEELDEKTVFRHFHRFPLIFPKYLPTSNFLSVS